MEVKRLASRIRTRAATRNRYKQVACLPGQCRFPKQLMRPGNHDHIDTHEALSSRNRRRGDRNCRGRGDGDDGRRRRSDYGQRLARESARYIEDGLRGCRGRRHARNGPTAGPQPRHQRQPAHGRASEGKALWRRFRATRPGQSNTIIHSPLWPRASRASSATILRAALVRSRHQPCRLLCSSVFIARKSFVRDPFGDACDDENRVIRCSRSAIATGPAGQPRDCTGTTMHDQSQPSCDGVQACGRECRCGAETRLGRPATPALRIVCRHKTQSVIRRMSSARPWRVRTEGGDITASSARESPMINMKS